MYVILRTVTGAVRRRLLRRIRERFPPTEIVLATVNANYFGLASRKGREVRGNAALVLTREALWSCLGAPLRELSIPLKNIREVSLVKSYCGRSLFVDLLRVSFATADGKDAAAWYAPHPQQWKDAIAQQQGDGGRVDTGVNGAV